MLDFGAVYTGRTLVFGHRGAKAYAPMNTLPAFELALKQGADGIELDVHRSADGYAVICHDYTVDTTSNGSGRVTDKTLAELKALDAGSWFSPEFVGVQIPTLDEVFEAVGQSLYVNVEIKSEDTETTDGVEQVVADCIVRHNMQDRVIVSSFNPFTLLRFSAIAPHIAIGYLYISGVPDELRQVMDRTVYEAYHPYFKEITPEMVQAEHAAGRVLNTWTVNAVEDALALRKMGVDCVITDNPDLIVKAFAEQA